jgi:hypothetical protein
MELLWVFVHVPHGNTRSTRHVCRWDLFQVIFIVYMAAMVPVRVGFDYSAFGVWFWFEMIVDTYFWVDLLLNFLTAYTDSDTNLLETKFQRIAQQYLRSWFFVDIIAVFPMDYIVMASKVDAHAIQHDA